MHGYISLPKNIMDYKAPDARRVWETTLGELQVQMPRETFDAWLRDTRVLAHEDGSYIIGVPNAYAREWLDKRLKKVVLRILRQISRRNVEVSFVLWNGDRVPTQEEQSWHDAGPLWAEMPKKQEPTFQQIGQEETGLNPRFTFDGYAVGDCNRLALAAAQAVVDAPGVQFNPLYICGDVGMGKTHLLHAIGNSAVERGLRVLYVTAEAFTNDLVGAIKARKMDDFRAKYRDLEVLLFDDTQFIAGKDATQEEFYHTFNTLFNNGAQIVLASNFQPSTIQGLDAQLQSRFEGGLTVRLDEPDFLTRVSMLEMKAEQRRASLPWQTIEEIAERIQGSFRELEGALNQVLALALLSDSVDVSEALQDIQSTPAKTEAITIHEVVQAVAEFYRLTADDLYGRGRSREISSARQVAMYIAYQECDCSLPEIGEAFGGRNHSTVLYGCEKVSDLVDAGSKVGREIATITQSLTVRVRAK